MNITKGDLIELAKTGEFDVIIHGCNCFCTMGAGIAQGIKAHFPEAYYADINTKKGDIDKLGAISYAKVRIDSHELIIVNAYTQFHYRGTGRKVDYDALKSCFKEIKQQFGGLRIGYPAIGAGLAGGDWNVISEIINEELKNETHTFVKYQP